ncbi:MAG TPA: hypothetical protein VJX66_04685, partial [Amycolatopsis sp.]|nr:hypothetical protein [Amycolatopsis sp.]
MAFTNLGPGPRTPTTFATHDPQRDHRRDCRAGAIGRIADAQFAAERADAVAETGEAGATVDVRA